jgi:hypothetical protein
MIIQSILISQERKEDINYDVACSSEKIAAHKRSNCINMTAEEKKLLSKENSPRSFKLTLQTLKMLLCLSSRINDGDF